MAEIRITKEMVDSLTKEDAQILLDVLDTGNIDALAGMSDAGKDAVLGPAAPEGDVGAAQMGPIEAGIRGAMSPYSAARRAISGAIESGAGLEPEQSIQSLGAMGGGLIGGPPMAGLGAAGAEAWRQVGQRFGGLPGEAPETSMEAATRIGGAGLEALLADLLFMGGAKVGKGIVTTIGANRFLTEMPAPAMHRTFERPDKVLEMFDFTQAAVEKKGAKGIEELWNAAKARRRELGQAIDSALSALQKRTGGQRIFNLTQAADDAESAILLRGVDDPEVYAALRQSDPSYASVEKLIESIRANPMKTAKECVELRRSLDAMRDWTGSTAQVASNNPSQAGISALSRGINRRTSDVARAIGDDALPRANSDFSSYIDTYDELLEVVPLRSDSQSARLLAFERVKSAFNRGGLRQEIMERLGRDIPDGVRIVDDLYDASAAHPFTLAPKGTPSGAFKDVLRFAATPAGFRHAIRAVSRSKMAMRLGLLGATTGTTIGEPAARGVIGGMSAAAEALSERPGE